MVIAIDFDGTLCKHEFPAIGDEVPGAIQVCKDLIQNGHKLILHTMRCNTNGRTVLQEAVDWCKERGVEFWGVNENPEQTATKWSGSPKSYAQLYIDDAALGCPLNTDSHSRYYERGYSGRPWVDWMQVKFYLEDCGALPIPIRERKAGLGPKLKPSNNTRDKQLGEVKRVKASDNKKQ